MDSERSAPTAGEPWLERAASTLDGVDPVVADSCLALGLAVPLLVDLSNVEVPGPPLPFRATDLLGYALVALLVVPLALRRRYPIAVFSTILGAAIVVAVLAYAPASYGFGLIVATYTVARWCDRRASLAALAAALAFSIFVKLRFMAAGVDIDLFEWPLDLAYIAGGWFLGDSIRTRTRQTAELERNREALAQQAVENEHLRIGRELHDSLGHSLSVMVLYGDAAERAIGSEPERARELIRTITRAGRDALEEMDRLVRVLREETPLTAGVDDMEALADEFRVLGLPVGIQVTGSRRPLPRAVELSAYRIAQEALTNTLKHAGARSAQLCLDYTPAALTVSVADDGNGSSAVDLGLTGRHGLTGIRERAASLGGDVCFGNRPDCAGFLVRARLPVTSEVEE